MRPDGRAGLALYIGRMEQGDDPQAWRRPTSADVAKLAGVSPTTVSLVLSGKATRISEATKARVLGAVEDLGYRPNRAAQGLRRGRSSTIGLITDQIAASPFSGPIVSGAHDVAWERGHMLIMMNATVNARRGGTAVDNLLDQQVDAILYAAIGTREVRLPQQVHRVPTVMVNAFPPDHDLPAIIPDEWSGARALGDHLFDLGHRHVAMLAGVRGAWATGVRVRALRQAMQSAGVRPDPSRLYYGNYRFDSGYALAHEAMQRNPRPTALVCGNDQMAAGAYLALARMGLRIPEDVTVVGYDDEPLAALLDPPLTTVTLPFYELGRLGATLLLDTPDALKAGTHVVDCPVVVRGSSAPPPADS